MTSLLFSVGESSSICPFLENNGDEAPKGSSPIIFQEWTDTSTFSYLKYTSTRRLCKLKGNLYFTHVHDDNFSIVYFDFYHQIMESCIKANYTVGVF